MRKQTSMPKRASSAPGDLIARLRKRGIIDQEVLEAMRRVPRHRFVEPGLRALAYDDRPLPSAHSPPLPQPYVAALVASVVAAGGRRRVLEVGTDSGYMVALLAQMFDEAYTIERHRDVAERAQRLLGRLGVNVALRHGDGGRGWPEHAPYDAIVVMAGATRPPSALVEQLAEGGTLVIPIGTRPLAQRLTTFTKTADGLQSRDHGPVSFVPLVGAGGWGPEYSVQPVVKTGAAIVEQLRSAARPVDLNAPDGLRVVLDEIGDTRIVLLGASTHGTSEFQRMRAQLTLDLVEQGFDMVVMDTDWSHGAHLDRFVQGTAAQPPDDPTPWAWHNRETRAFLGDLRTLNADRAADRRVHCYGLDLFDADQAAQELAPSGHLDDDPAADARASDRVAALAALANPAAGPVPAPRTASTTKTQAAAKLRELCAVRVKSATAGPDDAPLVPAPDLADTTNRSGRFYEALSCRDPLGWLLREDQSARTLEHLIARHGNQSRVVVWAHNVHVGDARATGLAAAGMRNLGQRLRERFGTSVYSLGAGAYEGSVLAAPRPNLPGKTMPLPPAAPKSHEHLCHATGLAAFFLDLSDPRLGFLSSARAQRAIGTVHRADPTPTQHYLMARLTPQFDGYVWFDQTTAVTPIAAPRRPMPEAYPLGV